VDHITRLELVSAILQESSSGSNLYHLRNKFGPYLSASQINKYLIEMTKCGLITPTRRGFDYNITSKGSQFLALHRELLNCLPGNNARKISINNLLFTLLHIFFKMWTRSEK